jgi:hypothetical protein
MKKRRFIWPTVLEVQSPKGIAQVLMRAACGYDPVIDGDCENMCKSK